MSTTRKLTIILGKSALNGLCYAAGGAIDGAIGAKVMEDGGHSGYDVLESVRVGAAGAAVVGTAVGLLKEFLHLLDQKYHFLGRDDDVRDKKHFDQSFELMMGEIVLGIGTMAAAGALGHEMLLSIAEMSLSASVVALSVGAAVMAAACLALFCCCYSCLCCCKAVRNDSENRAEAPSFRDLRKTSIGDMFRKASASRGDVEAPAPDVKVVEVPEPAAASTPAPN